MAVPVLRQPLEHWNERVAAFDRKTFGADITMMDEFFQ